jgi:hypothetical protein
LLEAHRANREVLPYLLGEKRLTKHPPDVSDSDERATAQWIAGGTRSFWQETVGAIAWVAATRTASEQPDPDRRGPALLLSPYPWVAFETCPDCDEPIEERPDLIVTLIEPDHVAAQDIPTRYCPRCDLLIMDQLELEEELAAEYDGSDVAIGDDDFVPVGLIDPAECPDPGAPLADTRAMEHVTPFRDRYDTATLAEFAEDLLRAPTEDEEDELGPAAKLMLRADG